MDWWDWKEYIMYCDWWKMKMFNKTDETEVPNQSMSWWDCVVDAWWNYDYTSVSDAIAAGKKSIYVKAWDYTWWVDDWATWDLDWHIIWWEFPVFHNVKINCTWWSKLYWVEIIYDLWADLQTAIDISNLTNWFLNIEYSKIIVNSVDSSDSNQHYLTYWDANIWMCIIRWSSIILRNELDPDNKYYSTCFMDWTLGIDNCMIYSDTWDDAWSRKWFLAIYSNNNTYITNTRITQIWWIWLCYLWFADTVDIEWVDYMIDYNWDTTWENNVQSMNNIRFSDCYYECWTYLAANKMSSVYISDSDFYSNFNWGYQAITGCYLRFNWSNWDSTFNCPVTWCQIFQDNWYIKAWQNYVTFIWNMYMTNLDCNDKSCIVIWNRIINWTTNDWNAIIANNA